jgi:hypothetical protein
VGYDRHEGRGAQASAARLPAAPIRSALTVSPPFPPHFWHSRKKAQAAITVFIRTSRAVLPADTRKAATSTLVRGAKGAMGKRPQLRRPLAAYARVHGLTVLLVAPQTSTAG